MARKIPVPELRPRNLKALFELIQHDLRTEHGERVVLTFPFAAAAAKLIELAWPLLKTSL